MQISLDIQDEVYQKLVSAGVDIREQFREFARNLVSSDNYKGITFEEAQQRVSDAVKRYESGTGSYLDEDEYEKEMKMLFDDLENENR